MNKTLPEIKKVLISTKKVPYETNKWMHLSIDRTHTKLEYIDL